MTTTTITTTTPPDVGHGRYQLTPSPAGDDVPTPGVDTRLGRRVLVQHGRRPTASDRWAGRLARVTHAAVAPLLDAGDDVTGDGAFHAYTVFPADDGVPFAAVDGARWAGLDPATVAGVAAWIVAAAVVVQNACGTTVALCSGDLVVDPELFDGASADRCPVRWMPSPAERDDDDLPGVVATLLAARPRWEQRRCGDAAALTASVAGRPRAVRLLAGAAGLDPQALGLPPHVPRHAGPERRSFGRRPPVRDLLATTRSEHACASVEVFS